MLLLLLPPKPRLELIWIIITFRKLRLKEEKWVVAVDNVLKKTMAIKRNMKWEQWFENYSSWVSNDAWNNQIFSLRIQIFPMLPLCRIPFTVMWQTEWRRVIRNDGNSFAESEMLHFRCGIRAKPFLTVCSVSPVIHLEHTRTHKRQKRKQAKRGWWRRSRTLTSIEDWNAKQSS